MKILFTLSIGYGGRHKEVMEFPDNTPEKEIDEAYQDWCSNYIDGGWRHLDEDEPED